MDTCHICYAAAYPSHRQSILASKDLDSLTIACDLDLPDDPRRVASDAVVRRDVLSHDAAGTDSRALANSHPGQHDDVPAQPTVLTDDDGLAALRPPDSVSDGGIQGVGSAVERTVGSYQGARPD